MLLFKLPFSYCLSNCLSFSRQLHVIQQEFIIQSNLQYTNYRVSLVQQGVKCLAQGHSVHRTGCLDQCYDFSKSWACTGSLHALHFLSRRHIYSEVSHTKVQSLCFDDYLYMIILMSVNTANNSAEQLINNMNVIFKDWLIKK